MLKIGKWSKPKTRRYIHPSLGVEGFFHALNQQDVQYAVLRWFESLPQVHPGEDIDILVRDADLPTLAPLLQGNKYNGIPCDVYSESGIEGSAFRKMAYFPPHLARMLLEHATRQSDLCSVPDPTHHFLSMCYHVLYHKGEKSGLPNAFHQTDCLDHNYQTVLSALAQAIDVKLPNPLTLETLDEMIDAMGWRPPMDTLEKLSHKNEWIRHRFFSGHPDDAIEEPLRGIGVLVVREAAEDELACIENLLDVNGFDIIFSGTIPRERRADVAKFMRGGNWGRGPWPHAGGLPCAYFVVMDLDPLEVSNAKIARKHIGLTNFRIYKTKVKIRNHLNHKKPKQEWSNPLHSSDNARQAFEYMDLLCPQHIAEIKEKATALNGAFEPPYPVVRRLSGNSRRAKVLEIDYQGQPAVCKIFRPGRERFMLREIQAREIANGDPRITKILATGPNYIVVEWVDDCRAAFLRKIPPFGYPMLPLSFLSEAKDIIRMFRKHGYEYIDFIPRNMLITKQGDIKVIDFEFLQPGHVTTESTQGNYAWYPAPENYNGDLPEGYRHGHPFRKWKREFGIPLRFIEKMPSPMATHMTRVVTSLYLAQREISNKLALYFKR